MDRALDAAGTQVDGFLHKQGHVGLEWEALRVYAYPDQHDATFVHAGDPAEITLSERPGIRLGARVTRLSGELDPKTRTLLTEIDFDNRDGLIVPGSFVEVCRAGREVQRGVRVRCRGERHLEATSKSRGDRCRSRL